MAETPEQTRLRMLEEQNKWMMEQREQDRLEKQRMYETMSTLQRTMANLVLNRTDLHNVGMHQGELPRERVDDRGVKIEVPEFDGSSLDPETYLDWERSIERFFEYKSTPEEQQYKFAKLKLGGQAQYWLEGKQQERGREGRARIHSWSKLKKCLRRRFVPTNYQQQLYIRWSSLRQDKKTVGDYLKEFEKLSISCQIEEREEMKIGRFVGGLCDDLREKLETHSSLTFDEAVRLAHTYEKQKKKGRYSSSYGQDSPGSSGGSSGSSMRETKPKEVPLVVEAKGDSRKDPTAFKDVKCFKCLGYGHYQRDCPNKRGLTALEVKELQDSPLKLTESEEEFVKGSGMFEDGQREASEVEEDSTDEEVCVGATTRRVNLLSRFALHSNSMKTNNDQRETIFHTKCEVEGKVLSLIIDGGSCSNMVASEVVGKLGLVARRLEEPYKLRWLDDDQDISVNKRVLLSLAIGPYKDEFWCDVVPMEACHVLLGRPWQSDCKVAHDGYLNTYSLKQGSKKYTLKPMKPSEIRGMYAEFKNGLKLTPRGKESARQEVKRAVCVRKEIMVGNRDYMEGELVWVDVRHGKFSNKDKKHKRQLIEENSAGPFRVMEKTSKGSYLVELSSVPSICAKFEVDELTPYADKDLADLRANPFQEGGFEPCSRLTSEHIKPLDHLLNMAWREHESKDGKRGDYG